MEFLCNLDLINLSLVLFSAFLVGASKAGIKGVGLLIVPMMAAVFGAKQSTGIVLPMLIMADVMAVIYYRRSVNRKYIIRLLPWALAGIIIGVVTGEVIDEGHFRWLLGTIIIAMLILLIYNDLKKSDHIPDNRFFAGVMGLAGGFATMVGNAAGPVFSIYLLSMKLPKREFIGTGAWFFFIINLSKVPFHIFSWNTMTVNTLVVDLVLLPLIVVGMFTGIRLVNWFSEGVYRYSVIIMTFIAAMAMLFS
ncbi:MAG: sulfite exporter TauE/SafE family protein [Bacteroidales bacterium]